MNYPVLLLQLASFGSQKAWIQFHLIHTSQLAPALPKPSHGWNEALVRMGSTTVPVVCMSVACGVYLFMPYEAINGGLFHSLFWGDRKA